MTAKQLKLLYASSCSKADKLQYDKIIRQIKSLKNGEFHTFFYEALSRKVKALARARQILCARMDGEK